MVFILDRHCFFGWWRNSQLRLSFSKKYGVVAESGIYYKNSSKKGFGGINATFGGIPVQVGGINSEFGGIQAEFGGIPVSNRGIPTIRQALLIKEHQ